MRYFYLLLIIITLTHNYIISQIVKNSGKEKYQKNVIVFKIKPEYKSICKNDNISDEGLNSILNSINTKSIKRIFPHSQPPVAKYNRKGEPLTDLSQIYEIFYDSNTSIFQIIKKLKSNPAIVYAQPHYLPDLLYVPNDNLIPNQYYLDNIRAFEAWDICRGDSTIVIGIVDTGTQIDHEDLVDNIAYNYNDPIDGIDNDGDGYIDNFRGWDLGDNDNNPEWNENNYPAANPHGVYVSGYAAARTDNFKGIAGTGFKTKFLPVKISDSTGTLTMAYEGIVYAADHGCSIINCSWGGNVADDLGRDVINYATFNKNALVVAAAGNSALTTNDVLYPCAYDNVLCVGATDINDLKWNHTCYGPQVDICAPGVNVLTTFENNSYNNGWGTSFASPIVAGCAAIVKAYYPDSLTPLQIGQILKITADNIDTIAGNLPYAHFMGTGRVNLYRALTDTLSPSVVFGNILYNNSNNNNFNPGDTIFINGKYTNYLNPSKHLNVLLSSGSPFVKVIDSVNNIGVLNTLDTFLNNNDPFIIKILPNVPPEANLLLKLTYLDTNYYAEQYFTFVANKSFIDIDTNNISTTITSNGRIGFNNFLMLNGIGFNYKNSETLLSESGFLFGNSITRVSDCLYGDYDFKTLESAHYINNFNKSDLFVQTKFNDDSSGNKLNISVTQNTYSWVDSVNADYIILEYFLKNNNNYTINDLYAGIFADWDLVNPNLNKVAFDSANRFSYTYYTGQNNTFTGIKLLSNTPINHYAIDNIAGGNGGIDITDGFTKQEEFYALSTEKNTAGIGNSGNDVADLLSSGPFSVNMNDSIRIAFALMAADNLFSLENIARQAQAKYDSLYINNINIIAADNPGFEVFPNPAKNYFNIYLSSGKERIVNIDLIDNTGKVLKTLVKGKISAGKYSYTVRTDFPKGLYLVRYESGNLSFTRKISIL